MPPHRTLLDEHGLLSTGVASSTTSKGSTSMQKQRIAEVEHVEGQSSPFPRPARGLN
jgi:hypothetical protein